MIDPRSVIHRAFFRSRLLREIVAAARWPKTRKTAPDLAHLTFYTEEILGPVQRDEALLLHALIRVVRPRTVVEIGFLRGLSSFNFLRALDADAHIYSFDVEPRCSDIARERFGHDPRLAFRLRSQTEITLADIDGRVADFVFLDASHDLTMNIKTFERLLSIMAPNAILAVHDTGTIPRGFIPPDHWWHRVPEIWVGDEGEVESDERAFVNRLLLRYPEFSQIHLHATRTSRAGLTLLQRTAPLPRPAGARE
jgi:predicted O-methyltransferase YrrM